MSRPRLARALVLTLFSFIATAGAARAQIIWYVDDDAPHDPGPGDPAVSDPLEDGSADHPFDAIQEGLDAADHGDRVLLSAGTYRGSGNRDIDFLGKAVTVSSPSIDPHTCVIDCEATGYDPHRGFQFVSDEGPDSVLAGVTITNGCFHTIGDWGGAVFGQGSGPTFIRCVFSNSIAYEGGGACFTSAASPTFIACTFRDNEAYGGGGASISSASSGTFINCAFAGNIAGLMGGGIGFAWSMVTIANCSFTENFAPYGAGVDGGFAFGYEVHNSIIAFNRGGEGIYAYGDGSSPIDVRYCDVFGNEGGDWIGCIADQCGINGNIAEDPCFAEPRDDRCRLASASPCIDAGGNPEVPTGVSTDRDGRLRFADRLDTPDTGHGTPPIVDMGCYEYQCDGDLNGDGLIDLSDLATLLAGYGAGGDATYADGDIDRDGEVDLADLAILLAAYDTICE